MTTAVDLSHHLSRVGNARALSPLKGLMKYIVRPGMVSLAGGAPDPAYFPFASLTAKVLVPASLQRPPAPSLIQRVLSLLGAGAPPHAEETTSFTVQKYPAHPSDINLATALQYSDAQGIQQLKDFVHTFTGRVHRPAYSDWTTLVDFGNTDGISRALLTLCNPGEQLLVEDWVYVSMLSAARPLGIEPAAVKTDGGGLSSADLERVLAEWDEAVRGAKRPHVLYTVPIGQNPTGSTMDLTRKKAIYAVCVKYDVVIIEDDPYFFLQEGTWVPKNERPLTGHTLSKEGDTEMDQDDRTTRFINSLTPSFLRVDYQGRVIRLDTFSKIIAPGSRMGWITANPLFTERFERHGEVMTQAPCGFAQSLIAQLLTAHWTLPHFFTWLQDLQAQYIARRDFFVDTIFATFDVRRGDAAAFGGSAEVYTAHPRRGWLQEKGGPPLFSFVPPSSGMFVWLKFHLRDPAPSAPEPFETRLWTDLAEHGLLLAQGSWFAAAPGGDPETVFFRAAYSMGTEEVMRKGVGMLAAVLEKYV